MLFNNKKKKIPNSSCDTQVLCKTSEFTYTVENNYFSSSITVFIQHRKLGQTLPPVYVNQQARKCVTQSKSV